VEIPVPNPTIAAGEAPVIDARTALLAVVLPMPTSPIIRHLIPLSIN